MKLYWGTNDDLKLLGEYETKEQVFKRIYDFIEEQGFKSYYQRLWCEPDGTLIVDYGSYTRFFYVKGSSYGTDLCNWL